jgi:YHS domain-containing protein
MKYVFAVTALAAAFLLVTANAGDQGKGKFAMKCPVSGKPASKEFAADHNGGKIYFCCPNCPGAFAGTPEKFAAKANHQLVGTGQAKQKACMLMGGEVDTTTKITVEGVNVCFCCMDCQAKAKAAKGAAQINLLFNDKAFKKGFTVKKAS